tara:strand:- start:746 stop:955 length:210 start_codon:yes stop_codon:yes gene_type:complete
MNKEQMETRIREQSQHLLDLAEKVIILERKVRNLTELRYSGATKKELRDYVNWHMSQRKPFSNKSSLVE